MNDSQTSAFNKSDRKTILASPGCKLVWACLLCCTLCPAVVSHEIPSGQQTPLTRVEQLEQQFNQFAKEIQALQGKIPDEQECKATHAQQARRDSSVDPKGTAASLSPSANNRSLLGSIDLSGFIDTYYGYNFNQPDTRISGMRAFDAEDNQFSLNLIEAVLSKTPEAGNGPMGFRFSIGFGQALNVVNGVDPAGLGFAQYIQEGYLSYLAPVGRGLQIDVGKFASTFGTEVIETKDNWNYSRGLLFTYAGPNYHLGMRAQYSFSNKYALTGYLVNGWDNLIDNNKGKTAGLSFTWTPNRKLSIIQSYMGGPEQPAANGGWRHLSDTVVNYSLTNNLALGLTYDYGRGDRVQPSGNPVDWTGVASYVRYALNDKNSFAARYEYYDDVDGFTTGTAQHINEFTTTFEHRATRNFIFRLEFRRDISNQPSFLKGELPVKTQNTLTAGLVYTFHAKEDR